jgi:hypothetical protein
MHHPIIEHFVNEIRTAKQPCFTTENQVVCGRISITASPSIDSKKLQSLKLEMPVETQLHEATYFYMFLVSVFGAETFCDFEPRIKPAMVATGEFSETINDWKLRMFIENDSRVVLAEAMSQ